MSKKLIHIILAVLMVVMLPWATVITLGKDQSGSQETEITEELTETATVANEQMIKIIMEDGAIKTIGLEEYIVGVVLREMPVDFEMEALKAQAVVARTYAMRRKETGGKHTEAPVCASPACCQGYLSPDTWSGDAQELEKVRRAVMETAGFILCYNGELIDATYYSCSGGKTEDALVVWGTDIPYLQSVSSPGEEKALHYTDTVTHSVVRFQELLGRSLPGRPETWFGKTTYTDGGGVETIQIGGQEYTGLELRQTLSLRSTAFVINAVGDTVTITTKGFGHRVGMSQYGADAMAAQGSGYEEILCHYYPGTELQPLSRQH